MTSPPEALERRLRLPALLRRSLRARLVASFVVLAVVTVALLGLLVNARATDYLRTAVTERMAAAAALKVDVVERWLDEEWRNVLSVAGLLSRGPDGTDPVHTLLLGDGTPTEIDAAAAEIDEILTYIADQSPDTRELAILDEGGTIVASTVPEHVGGSHASETYFERGRASTFVERLETSPGSDEPAIAVATPLFDSTGERVGVLASYLDIVRVDRIIRDRTGLGGSGETFIVGNDGRLVSSAIGAAPGDAVTSEGIQAALAGGDGQAEYETASGTPVIGAWAELQDLDATLVAEMAQQEAFAPARELAATIALVGFGAVALLAFGIAVIGRAITRPIVALADAASEVARGNFDATAPVTSEDEVGTLERTFNDMTAQLRESVETLEHRVEERTAELSQRNSELAIVNEVGQALARQLDFQAILEAVGERAAEALSARGLSIAMRDAETGVVTFHYWIDEGVRNRQLEGTVLNDALTNTIIETGRPVRISSARQAEELGMPFKVAGTESYLGVPIPAGDRAIGVIAIGTREQNAYSDDDERLLTTLATNMGVALDNARLFAELNAAVRAQSEAEARYRRLVEELPLSLYIDQPDASAQSIYVNPTIETMFGYPAERWFEEDFFESIIHPDDRDEVLANHTAVFERGDERWTWEYRLIHADGHAVVVHDEGVIVRDANGTALYVQGFLMDVTEEREAHARVEAAHTSAIEAEARYRQLVEEMPIVMYIDKADGSLTSSYISPQAEPMFGYPVDSWLDDGFFQGILHPDDRDRVQAEQDQVPAGTADRYSSEYRIAAADGHRMWVRDDGRVVFNPDGTPSHVQGFMLDVTEQKEAEAEVRRQKTYFESLVEASPVAIVVMDRDEQVTAWNPAAERLFGYSAEEAVGAHIDTLIFSEDRRSEGAVTTTEAREKGRSHRIDQRMCKGGGMVDVEIVVVPLMIDGEHLGYYAIYHDISELTDARRAAESANQAKSAFLAAMSHEIRTPMNAIIGMSGLLVDTPLSDEQHDYAETIRTSGDALLTIINDILDFSKIEAGKVELDEAPFSLPAVIEGALDVLAPAAAAKGIELAYAAPDRAPPPLVGDAGRLRQILLNLLSNAVKFTESGEVVLAASGSELPDGRWEIAIEVRDTGIGIPTERLGQLFQSFSQLDASVSRRYGGTGLGLAISRRLAELMDGSLMATSSGVAGEGSTFRLGFRAAVATEAVPTRVPSAPADGMLSGRRVLIVDDNATNRRILVAQAKRWGMEPRDAASGTTALGWVRKGDAFDVALLDLNMPGMDGVAVARALNDRRRKAKIPAIILSSIGSHDFGDAPIAGSLTKPVKPSALHDALADALGAAASAPSDGEGQAAGAKPAEDHPLRILLAEDNAVNRKLALKLLEQLGYGADVAHNGLEAVEAVEGTPYDVVLMDVQMPELDGLEATRRIRGASLAHAQPRIVAMTANAMAGDREACLAAGMDDYLSKPIRPPELAAALERVAVAANA